MIKFARPGIQIPSADTLRQDLTINFNSAKDNFRRELQVSKKYMVIKIIIYYLLIINKY